MDEIDLAVAARQLLWSRVSGFGRARPVATTVAVRDKTLAGFSTLESQSALKKIDSIDWFRLFLEARPQNRDEFGLTRSKITASSSGMRKSGYRFFAEIPL